jgi:DNA-directed RNA polymerase subunit beta'
VLTGDTVGKGDVLSAGAPRYDDLLRLRGIEAVRHYLFHELRTIYRENGVHIDDKHFEVILARTVARWRIDDPGDTALLSGAIVGWRELVEANHKIEGRVRITEAGSTALSRGTLLDEQEFLAHRQSATAAQRAVPLAVSATPATATPLGITLAALEVDSFLSAASFQHPRKVLMEAALAGKVDPLHGLKENILLGRLIPAGTGFVPGPGVNGSP